MYNSNFLIVFNSKSGINSVILTKKCVRLMSGNNFVTVENLFIFL